MTVKSEIEIRQMLQHHTSEQPDARILQDLAKKNPGTTIDYWLGYFDGVTFGYTACLKD